MRTASARISAAIALCFAAATQAAVAETRSPSLLEAIELWLVANFALAPAAAPPSLASLDAQLLVEMRYGPGSPVAPGEVVAVYDHAANTIYVTEGWTGRSPADLSVLVHEMVHHLQAASGMRFACPAEREALAYEAQDAWLRLFGMELETALGVDEALILVSTACTY